MCVIRLERLYVLTKKKPVISKDMPETIGSLKTSSEFPEYAAAAEKHLGQRHPFDENHEYWLLD